MRFLSYVVITASVLSLISCSGASDQANTSRTCPDWSDNPIHNHQNTDFSNFGCAYYNDIAVQVENPDDLQQGHGILVGNGDRDSVNAQKYLTATQMNPPIVSSTSASR